VLTKFHQRFNILSDELAKITFKDSRLDKERDALQSQEQQHEENT
jgi:predicted Zn-dependent peptidase